MEGFPERRFRFIRTLEELLASCNGSPEPKCLVPKLAWKERSTLLVAREKTGKSTLATAVALAVAQGGVFLGQRCTQGPVLYLGLEEHGSDISGRLLGFGARVDDPICVVSSLPDPFTALEEALIEFEERFHTSPALIVLDSLTWYAHRVITESSSSTEWTRVMTFLNDLVRDRDSALLILHHATKKTGEFRDSGAIGACVDMIINMRPSTGEKTVREMQPSGRWYIEPFSVRLVQDEEGMHYETPAADLSSRIIDFVQAKPGCSVRQVSEGVAGATQGITHCVNRLIHDGEIVNKGTGSRYSLHVALPQQGSVSEAIMGGR